MVGLTITARLRMLIAIALSALTLVAGISFYSLYIANRPIKTNYDSSVYPSLALPDIVALLSESYYALEYLASTDQIIRQEGDTKAQTLSTALLNNFVSRSTKSFSEINTLLAELSKTLQSVDERSLYDSIVRNYQEVFRPQLQVPNTGAILPTTEEFAQRLSLATLGLTAIAKDIDSLTSKQFARVNASQIQYQRSAQSYENMLWATIASLMIVMVLMSWMSIEIKLALKRILGGSPEEINGLVAKVFNSRLGLEVAAKASLPKNVRTALIVFPEALQRVVADVKKTHDQVITGDQWAQFDPREHHTASRETLVLIHAMLAHILQGQGEKQIDLAAKTSPSSTTLPFVTTALTEGKEDSARIFAETIQHALTQSEQLSNATQAIQASQGVLLKLNAAQHAELHYAAVQTTTLLNNMHRIPNRLTDGEKACDALIQATLEGQKQLSTVSDAIELVQKNTQQLGAQLSVLENIALQGDMLAFNISIEVARLGGEARGFSAIGSEVRHLAERAMAQSQSIRTLISDTDTTVLNAQDNLHQVAITNKDIYGGAHRINAITQSSAELAQLSLEALSELAAVREKMQAHSHEQSLLVHHQATLSNSLVRLANSLEQDLGGTSKNNSSPAESPSVTTLTIDAIPVPPSVTAAVAPPSNFLQANGAHAKPVTSNKPIVENEWSLF